MHRNRAPIREFSTIGATWFTFYPEIVTHGLPHR